MIQRDNKVSPVIIATNLMSASLGDATKIPAAGSVIPAGQIIEWYREGEVSKFNLWKTAKVYEALSSSATPKVEKGHLYEAGDTIFVTASRTILGVDKTNELYDIITLDATDSIADNSILYNRENPGEEGVFRFAFIKDEITIEEGQTLLSVPVSMGVIDNRIFCNMLGYSATQSVLNDSEYLKISPTEDQRSTMVAKNYVEYVATITQTTTGVPILNIISNELNDAIVYTRDGAGAYVGTLVGAFTEGKTVFNLPNGNKAAQFGVEWTDADTFALSSWVADGTATDSLFATTSFSIKVYD